MIDKQAQVPVGNTGTIKLSGSNFLSIADITFEGKTLSPKVTNDAGTEIEITLPSQMTDTAGNKQLNIALKNGKSKTYILIVEARK